ncbi:zinc finger, C2H2 type [Cooperia oncophora]
MKVAYCVLCLFQTAPPEESTNQGDARLVPFSKPDEQKCGLCGKSYTFYRLLSHLRTAHGETGRRVAQDLSGKTVPCTVGHCSYRGTSEEALRKHKAKYHSGDKENENVGTTEKMFWLCPLCDAKIKDQEDLNRHCVKDHGGDRFKPQMISFAAETDFKMWKAETELAHVLKWRRHGVINNKKGIRKYYVCHRSGVVRSHSRGMRLGRESKITTRHCTSFLKVRITEVGSVTAWYCVAHVGHIVTASSLPLCKSDKETIGHYLQLGLNIPTILRIIRKEQCDPNQRLYWISASDIRNTQEALQLLPGKLHNNDLESVKIRFNMNIASDGMRHILFPANERTNFRLVIITPEQVEILRRFSAKGISIDDTHCTTRYDLKLATLMTVDDYGRGVPSAFLLSSKMDKNECVFLSEEVKKVYEAFSPKFFLSDDTMSFWNAYKAVFPENETTKLLCAWHCLRAIFDGLKRFFPAAGDEKRCEFAGWIKVLFTQSNGVEFSRAKSHLLTLLNKWTLEGDAGSMRFLQYLRVNYLSRESQWAPYMKVEAIANTTIVSERWHRTLKYTLLNRSANRRVDELIDILIKAVPLITREHFVQDERRLMAGKYRAKENNRRHRKAVEKGDDVQPSRVAETQLVRSFTNNSRLSYCCEQLSL